MAKNFYVSQREQNVIIVLSTPDSKPKCFGIGFFPISGVFWGRKPHISTNAANLSCRQHDESFEAEAEAAVWH